MISLLLIAQLQACLPNPAGVVTGALGRRLHEHVRRVTSLGAFAGVVLVARHDTVFLHRGYGRAKEATCSPMTPDTRFDIASIAKPLTGLGLLLLEAEGRLHDGDSLGRWLPDAPADKAAITIHQLANHTSGLARDHADFFALLHAGNKAEIVREILAMPLDSAPGARFSYSNLGYNLLAAVIERAAEMPFEQFMHTRVFGPLGLKQTAFMSEAGRWPDAVAHQYWDQYDAGSPRTRVTSWNGLGGSQIVSSAGDLYRLLQVARATRLLPDSLRRRWIEPDSGLGYAYGWNVIKRPDGTSGVVFHAGAYTGAGGEIRYYPRTDLMLVVLTNLQHQDQLMQVDLIGDLAGVANARQADLPPFGGSAPSPDRLPSGRYVLPGESTITLWRARDGRVWLAPEGQKAFDLLLPPDTSGARRVPLARAATRALLDSLESRPCPREARLVDYPQAVLQTLDSTWCGLRAQLGQLQAVDTIGVRLPGWSDARAFVYTRLRFARGARAATWLWEGDGLVEMWQAPGVPYPQSLRAAEESPGVLLVYDWFRGAGRRLMFTASAGRAELAGMADSALVVARLLPAGHR